jgi:hypothetical protein
MRQAARPSVLRFSWQNVANRVSNSYASLHAATGQLLAQ